MIWVGLPAYNEAGKISELLIDIHKSLKGGNDEYIIVVYDDGSSDDTASQVLAVRNQGVNVHLIDGEVNKGLGCAFSYLIDYFVDKTSLEDTIVIMDADATHHPGHIHRMLSYIQDSFDLVIASRYTPYSRIRGVTFNRRLFSDLGSFIFKVLFPIEGVSDYTCGYRAYTAKVLKMAKHTYGDKLIEEHGFACMAELLLKIRRLGVVFCEVPLILRYDNKSGGSKMNVGKTILRTVRLIVKSFFLPKLNKL